MVSLFSGIKAKEEVIACSVALGLALIKGVAAYWTGALALLASALDSLMDFFASGVNLISIRIAEKPADQDHTFGHGKAEAIAGLLQSLLILASAGYLLYSCVVRFVRPFEIGHVPTGLVVMIGSLLVSLWVSGRLKKASQKTGSVALKSDSVHYAMDFYAQAGIVVAFFLIQGTGWEILDPIVTIPIAVYVGYLAARVGKEAVDELMDREASLPHLQQIVQEIVARHQPEVVSFHNLKTRHSAGKQFMQFHLEMRRNLTFERAHELTEQIAGDVRRALGNVQVMIHADPEGMGLDQTDLG